ncbi:hypothetical protein Glove_309g127 [Diversispora epigaea]|uniref:Uncharacterized protein n=1 Tax=Diversispora epigaea TaxID=1348612 RepID=A0A397HSV1_9GLOM|nr:hypothetical protein Glove_309g127 [Diversispora epigaea]
MWISSDKLSPSSKINWHHVTCRWKSTIAATQNGTAYIFGWMWKNLKTTNDQIFKIPEITNFQKDGRWNNTLVLCEDSNNCNKSFIRVGLIERFLVNNFERVSRCTYSTNIWSICHDHVSIMWISSDKLSPSSKINWHHVTCRWKSTIAATQNGTAYIFGWMWKNLKTTNDQIFKIPEITNFQKGFHRLLH